MTSLSVKVIGDHAVARKFAAYLSEMLQLNPPGDVCTRVTCFTQDRHTDAKRYQMEFDYKFEPDEEATEG